jgi:phosphoribosyl-ATP pyrophosphohydrolase
MIIPSIDLKGGQTVQLIGGKEHAISAGDPMPIARDFSIAGEIAVIDLDAALGSGDNEELIKQVIATYPARVGGGIRDVETAKKWLNAGATKVILGTKAIPEILSELPKNRVIAALDAYDGEVVVEGWQKKTGVNIEQRMQELRPYVDEFMVTFVELEGRLSGTNLKRVHELVEAAQGAKLTIAGGVTEASEIAELDKLGVDAQVGMALYTGKLNLADAILAPMQCDTETSQSGLWPTVVCDEFGVCLGLVWSNKESVTAAVKERMGIYHSRKRGLWRKGETSGATQELLGISLDCDRDTLCFHVKQTGSGFCHKETYTCFGEQAGLQSLFRTIQARKLFAPEGSYTKRLFTEQGLLEAKILEEAKELVEAKTKSEVAWEAADLLYFTFAQMARADVSLEDVTSELNKRSGQVSRRAGDAKSL